MAEVGMVVTCGTLNEMIVPPQLKHPPAPPLAPLQVVPYFYAVYLAGLLAHRSMRDDEACARKYGADWLRYKQAVPYRFIPYVL